MLRKGDGVDTKSSCAEKASRASTHTRSMVTLIVVAHQSHKGDRVDERMMLQGVRTKCSPKCSNMFRGFQVHRALETCKPLKLARRGRIRIVNIVIVARQVVVVHERLSYLSCQELSRSLIAYAITCSPSRVLTKFQRNP